MGLTARSLTSPLGAGRKSQADPERPVPVSWHEYLPAGAALAAFLYGLGRGDRYPLAFLLPGSIALLYPLWLAAERRLPQQGWTRFFRYFLPLFLLFPLNYVFGRLLFPAGTGGETAGYISYVQAAVVAYLIALLAYTFLGNFTGFRRLSLGLQGTFYLSFLLPVVLPFLTVFGSGPLLVTLMTFLLFHDFIFKQPSLIASFIILALLKVIAALSHPFAPAAEAIAILIPALVLTGLKVSGFPRR
jgi:hypothetical protein